MSKVKFEDLICVLLEFPNEVGTPISVAYMEWLTNIDINNVQTAISTKQEIVCRWPDNSIGVLPPSKSSQKKYNSVLKWSKVIAKVLAYGKWTEMCEKRQNLERYGTLDIKKHDRKYLSREKIDNENGDTLILNAQNNKEEAKKQEDLKKKFDYDVLEEQEKKLLGNKRRMTDSFEESIDTSSEEEGLGLRSSKTALIDHIQILKAQKERLNMENEKLKRENEHLQTIIDINDVIKKIKSNSTDLKENLKKCLNYSQRSTAATKSLINDQKANSSQSKPERKIEMKKNSMHTETKIMEQANAETISSQDKFEIPNNNLTEEQLPSSTETKIEISNSVENSTYDKLEENKILNSVGQSFNELQFQKLNHANIKEFTNGAINILFDRKILSTSTLSGGVPRCYSNLPNKLDYTKEKLDPKKVQIICDYVHKHVHPPGLQISNDEKTKLVRATITQKTNNARNPCNRKILVSNVVISPSKSISASLDSPNKTLNVAFNISS